MNEKKSIGMTNAPKFNLEHDPELDKQVLAPKKTYQSVRTPNYFVVISEITDSAVAYYQQGQDDKIVQQAPIILFKQLYKEVE